MRHGAVTAQIAIPAVVRRVQTHLSHTRIQYVQTLFTLRTTDDLTNARSQNVHRGNRFTVFVKAHIERLNIFRVVFNDDRCFEVFLCKITLMLRSQVNAPVNRVLEFLTAFLKDGDCIGVIHLSEICGNETLQTRNGITVYTLCEEFHVVSTFFKHRPEDIFQHCFSQACNIIQIRERHFRLQHPEFRQVTAGVGVFSTEGWAESIDLRQCAGVGFTVELARYRQEGLFTKEIFVVVHFAFRRARQVFHIQR